MQVVFRWVLRATAACGLYFVSLGAVHADLIINNTGIPNPAQTITFSEFTFPTETPITNQYASLGVTFSPALFYNVQPIFFPTQSLADFNSSVINNPVSIFFQQNQSGAAVAVQTNPGQTTFTALLNSVVVQSFTAATTLSFLPDLSQASNFYGFDNIVFNEFRIDSISQNHAFQIDNLQTRSLQAVVPEPTSIALLGLGAVGLLGNRWRRRGAF